jgi:hypothetical protein
MFPGGTQFPAAPGVVIPPPPTTPGEVGAGPRTPGEVTLGLLLIDGEGVLEPIDELPVADPGVEPIDEPGMELIEGFVLNVPVIGA